MLRLGVAGRCYAGQPPGSAAELAGSPVGEQGERWTLRGAPHAEQVADRCVEALPPAGPLGDG